MQRLRRLAQRASVRRSERAFVAEGAKLLESALDAGAAIEGVFHAPLNELTGHARALLDRAASAGIRRYQLAPGVVERVADAVSPQPLLSVVATLDVTLEDVLAVPLSLVLVDVRDPGNVGAILRSADAAGVGAVICSAGTGDLYNPKAVRASAGSIFHVPVVQGPGADELLEQLQDAGIRCVATAATGGADYATAALQGPLALWLGNEANGLDPMLASRCDEAVTVPIAGGAESLNVAMAATVLCFELARRRRGASAPGHSIAP